MAVELQVIAQAIRDLKASLDNIYQTPPSQGPPGPPGPAGPQGPPGEPGVSGGEQGIICADAILIDWSLGNTAYMTFDRPKVYVSMKNQTGGGVYRFKVRQSNAGGGTLIWINDINWRRSKIPVLTPAPGSVDIFTLLFTEGAWYADMTVNFGMET